MNVVTSTVELSTIYPFFPIHPPLLSRNQQPTTIDNNKLKPYFGGVNAETIKKTSENSTQWAVTSTRFSMRKCFKSRFPAFNIPCRNEAIATDTIFSETPAIDSGVTMAQSFVGKDSLVSDVYPMHSSNQFVNSLEDNIRFRGAMSKLSSDYAQVEISNKVTDILRMYHSSSWHPEPYHQNQKPSEWHYRTLKACWKHPSPFSNVYFRNTTKIAVQVLLLTFGYSLYF